jgi:hypothetical protein
MTESHMSYDALVALALDDAEERDRSPQGHLIRCGRCRGDYDELVAGVEDVLTATPRIDPPPGFDQRVLAAMGLVDGVTSPRRTPRRRAALLAAAAVLGALLGVGGTVAWNALDGPAESPGGALAASLDTATGESVGSVTPSYLEGEPVLVVRVHDGVVGKTYECVLVLEDGRTQVAGSWVMASPEATWVVPAPRSGVDAVRLVTGEGQVWSTADVTDAS